jgi:hypothetical protein
VLRQRGKRWFADEPADLRALLEEKAHGYAHEPVAEYAEAVCGCVGRRFGITVAAHGERVLLRCQACSAPLHPMPVARIAASDAPQERTCLGCGGAGFEVCAAFAPYSLYGPGYAGSCFVGGWCPGCGVVGMYADWPVPQSAGPIWCGVSSAEPGAAPDTGRHVGSQES